MKLKVIPVLFFLSCLVSCTSNYQKAAIKPVARVNDHILTAKEFADRLARRLKYQDAIAAKDTVNLAKVKESILTEFIEFTLVEDWAKVNNILVASSEVENEVSKVRGNYPDDLSFRRFLAEESLSFSDWRRSVQQTLLIRALFKKINQNIPQPTEEEIELYYKGNLAKFKVREKISLSQIVVAQESTAEQLIKIVKSKDFSALAKQYSVAPEAKLGGNVGWIEKGTVDFFDPLFTAPVGLVNKVIQTSFGYHIVRIDKKMGAQTKPLNDVKTPIRRALLANREQAEYVKWLDLQLRANKVYKDYDLINSITVLTKGSND